VPSHFFENDPRRKLGHFDISIFHIWLTSSINQTNENAKDERF